MELKDIYIIISSWIKKIKKKNLIYIKRNKIKIKLKMIRRKSKEEYSNLKKIKIWLIIYTTYNVLCM